jgi:hypothetical protein
VVDPAILDETKYIVVNVKTCTVNSLLNVDISSCIVDTAITYVCVTSKGPYSNAPTMQVDAAQVTETHALDFVMGTAAKM